MEDEKLAEGGMRTGLSGWPLHRCLIPSSEQPMNRYIVRFLKTVMGEAGHEVEICQRWFEIPAASQEQAIEVAKRLFCDAEGLSDWSLHADRIEVGEADFPS